LSVVLAGLLILVSVPTKSTELHAQDKSELKLKRFDFKEIHMGVDFRIGLYAHETAVANKAAKAAFRRIEQLNGILSDYDSKSEVRRLCEPPVSDEGSRNGKTKPPALRPVEVSSDLFRVLESAQRLSRESQGAFDVTVGPLTKLWRRAHRRKQLPDRKFLKAAREVVGFRNIKLNSKDVPTVTLSKAGMRIDLGGIAKGYAVDEALKVLAEHGIHRAMVDGSGDIAIGAPPPGREFWRVSVEKLDPTKDADATTILNLKNCAVATSGDAFQHVEINGRRYSHILDPKTGLGISQSSSVTVIAPTGMLADSLASAVSVMGPIKGVQLIDSKYKKCEAFIATADAKPDSTKIRKYESKSFRQFLSQ
jgi:FAD:protein FMN transferase